MPLAPSRRRARVLVALALSAPLFLGKGCLIGSPVAAFSGEPYGMTRDDVDALGGRRSAIWGRAPWAAAIDLPFAFVLDTGFLPISLLVWAIVALAGGGDEHGDPDADEFDDEESGGGRDRDGEADRDHDHDR